MNTVAIGNAPSRQGVDLSRLRDYGFDLIIGCNYLFREFAPDIIVSIDTGKRAYIERIKSRRWQWMTRERSTSNKRDAVYLTLDGEEIIPLFQINGGDNNNSGLIACAYLSEVLRAKRIYMLGFDFGTTKSRMPVLLKIFNRLVKHNPHTEFVRVGPIDDEKFWGTVLQGFRCLSYEGFWNEANTLQPRD